MKRGYANSFCLYSISLVLTSFFTAFIEPTFKRIQSNIGLPLCSTSKTDDKPGEQATSGDGGNKGEHGSFRSAGPDIRIDTR